MKTGIIALAFSIALATAVGCSSKTKTAEPETTTPTTSSDTQYPADSYQTASNESANLGASSSGFAH